MANTLLGKINDALDAMSDDMTGTAVAGDVLATKTFYNTSIDAVVTGTMSNKSGTTASASSASMGSGTTLNVVPPAGYYNGTTAVVTVDLAVVDTDLSAGNIKSGVVVLGVTGTYNGA